MHDQISLTSSSSSSSFHSYQVFSSSEHLSGQSFARSTTEGQENPAIAVNPAVKPRVDLDVVDP